MPNENPKTIGRRLAELRGSTPQRKVAAAADIDSTTLSRIERGIQNPTVDMVERIAAAMGYTVSDVFADSRVELDPEQLTETQAAVEAYLSDPEWSGNPSEELKSRLRDQDWHKLGVTGVEGVMRKIHRVREALEKNLVEEAHVLSPGPRAGHALKKR